MWLSLEELYGHSVVGGMAGRRDDGCALPRATLKELAVEAARPTSASPKTPLPQVFFLRPRANFGT